MPELEKLIPKALHAVRIVTKKLRYLTEFSAGLHHPEAVEPWLKWLKKAQEVLGARNDRAVAAARIKELCQSLEPDLGKVRHHVQSKLKQQPQPVLALPALPAPYWR